MMEAPGWKRGRRGGGCELPQTKWTVKQELFVTTSYPLEEGCILFHWTECSVCVSNKGDKLRKPQSKSSFSKCLGKQQIHSEFV